MCQTYVTLHVSDLCLFLCQTCYFPCVRCVGHVCAVHVSGVSALHVSYVCLLTVCVRACVCVCGGVYSLCVTCVTFDACISTVHDCVRHVSVLHVLRFSLLQMHVTPCVHCPCHASDVCHFHVSFVSTFCVSDTCLLSTCQMCVYPSCVKCVQVCVYSSCVKCVQMCVYCSCDKCVSLYVSDVCLLSLVSDVCHSPCVRGTCVYSPFVRHVSTFYVSDACQMSKYQTCATLHVCTPHWCCSVQGVHRCRVCESRCLHKRWYLFFNGSHNTFTLI